jgi:hypothetical protein
MVDGRWLRGSPGQPVRDGSSPIPQSDRGKPRQMSATSSKQSREEDIHAMRSGECFGISRSPLERINP